MTEPRLFGDDGQPGGGDASSMQRARMDGNDRADRVRRSALWSAYGDALGWIGELTDERGLRRRTAGAPLYQPIGWKRRIGGRSGATLALPQGCYSDDSQLRLATGRSIRSDGFDVEAFSKVELPVWLSYELGGGKSTSAAAAYLSRPRVQWFANTFKGWANSGGNGAAMRIQPHVWSAHSPDDPGTFLTDVVRNAICTHSHPNGLVGAVIHALSLARALVTGRHPSPDDMMAISNIAANLIEVVQGDVEVGQYWRAAFERESGPLGVAWARAVDDCREAIQVAADTSDMVGADRYEAIVNRLMLRDSARRGNGILTAVAAVGLIWSEPQPESALRVAANAIGTDTDTIATMAGAILGINAQEEPPVEVLDSDLFRSEADRLSEIAIGHKPQSHRYPDLLGWSAPKTRADALVLLESGGCYVRGLGPAAPQGEPIASQDPGFMWQWLKLEFGQTLLIKRRRNLPSTGETFGNYPILPPLDQHPPVSGGPDQRSLNFPSAADVRSLDVTHSETPTRDPAERSISHFELEAMIGYLESHKYDDKKVGQVIRRVVNRCTPGQIGSFLAVLIDCLRERPSPPSGQKR